jgi:beta-galactosidase
MSRLPRVFLSLLLAGSIAHADPGPRRDMLLAEGWKFVKADAGLTAPDNQWQAVTIPHTWNTKSADEGVHHGDPHFKYGYYRGPCWYARSLDIPADWRGKRLFIRFEAASLVAKTWLNGQYLGEHRGGFTAFCYELTPYLHYGARNELRVQVDNSHQEDVPPLSGDFNVDGGIYRPVHLLVTDPVCISPLNMASPGVYLTTKSLTGSAADIEVKTLVSNASAETANLTVKTEIADARGAIAATALQPASVQSGTSAAVISTLHIPSPRLWNGRKDPYLYTATVSLVRGNDILDSVRQPLGLRTVAISESQGFLLNGRPYPIYGVNRHQDWGGEGWAATPANDDEDMRLILDMGTTAIRLTHYPQSDRWHDRCDRNGLLLWNEVSLVNEVRATPEFDANAEQQLRELILQRYNHPSAVFWGLFNELAVKKKAAQPDPLLQHLKSVIHELDPARLIVAAIDVPHMSYNQIPDHPGFNRYPGWYQKYGEVEPVLEAAAKEVGKRIAVSEYGAGSNIAQHEEAPLIQPATGGAFHPEEWQTYVHETDWAAMKDNPLLWGTFVWVMFDFEAAWRHEGGQLHLNDKGLVTQDRKTKKDSYYFYQANWSDTPMVHIAARRMTTRRQAITGVEVFSNCGKVELTVNQKSLGAVLPDRVKVFRWPGVILLPGVNEIKATAVSNRSELVDTCQWLYEPATTTASPGN